MRYNIIILFLFISCFANSQSIFINYGKANTSFIYTDENGNNLDEFKADNLDQSAIGYEFVLPNNFNIKTSISSNNYASKSINQDYSWHMSYIGLDFKGVYYILLNKNDTNEINKIGGLKFLLSSGFISSFMTSGSQRIDNEIYDLSEFNDGSFNNLFMLSLGTGIQYPINKSTLICLGYSYYRGINNMESNRQSLYVQSQNIFLELKININEKK
tara:strand:+ start:697 stop:1341 length:645 start_codon:yes stop_codon:yes gene_type:complete